MCAYMCIVVLAALCAAVFTGTGCGHGQDLTLFVEGSLEDSDTQDIIIQKEELTPAQYAKEVVEGMAYDLLSASRNIVSTMGLHSGYETSVNSTVTKNIDTEREITLQRFGKDGNTMTASGTAILSRNGLSHCAIIVPIEIDYDSYRLNPWVVLDGAGEARVILTSYTCKFYRNMHVDITIDGHFTAGDQFFEQLVFEIDFDNTTGVTLKIKDAEIADETGTLYCYDDISTRCGITDKREAIDPCTVESPYTATYLLREDELVTYQTPLRCSDEGLWTPYFDN